MKKLLYVSAHSVLEWDELTLFTELGYDCFSLGAYTDPRGHYQLPRPGVAGMEYRPDLIEWSNRFSRTEIPKEFFDLFDLIIVMHTPEIIEQNWSRMKHKPVVWRTIGQSTPWVEKRLRRFRDQGLKIVRYSPFEAKLQNYIGEDVLIRFYKDPEEFKDWTGHDVKVINFTQTLKGRRDFCGYDKIMEVGCGFPFKVYGSGNEDLAEFNGGLLSYDLMKGQLRDSRVFLHSGTWPASYTLTPIEAWMTGIPFVTIGPESWKHKDHPDIKIFEVPKLIDNGDTGFWSDDTSVLKTVIQRLLNDIEYARKIGAAGRAEAINVFGKTKIKEEWKNYLEGLWV